MTLLYRGICVSDLAHSLAFYRDALGFVPQERWKTPLVHTATLGRPDGPGVLLREFANPAASGPRTRRSTLQYGLMHLSLYVDDIDAWAGRISAHGGATWERTRAHYAANRTTMLYCTDPDGVRIELMNAPGERERFSHGGICVDDVETSMAFYARLGFEPAENYVFDKGAPWLDLINEVPGIRLRAQMVRDPAGNTIELLKVYEPACFGPRRPQPSRRFGLTHLVFRHEDAIQGNVESDPDGVRITFGSP